MFAWITEWFYTVYSGPVSGPARNAPNNGVNIKKYIEEKPPEVKIITDDEVQQALENLKPIPIVDKPVNYTSPLMAEFNNVFAMGYKTYFEKKKSKNF